MSKLTQVQKLKPASMKRRRASDRAIWSRIEQEDSRLMAITGMLFSLTGVKPFDQLMHFVKNTDMLKVFGQFFFQQSFIEPYF